MKAPPNAPSLNDQAAQFVLSAIEAITQTHYVLSPGGRSAPLAFALGQRDAATSTVILDERQAAFYALGRARGDCQTLTTLICTSGSAGAHYLPALIEADYSGIALLVITADRPDRLRGVGAAQTIEQRNFFGHHVEHSMHINVDATSISQVPERVAALVGTAIQHQTPVHLNLAFDEPLHLGAARIDPMPASPRIDDASLGIKNAAEIACVLNRETQGLLILGPNSVLGTEESDAMMSFIRKLGWPCFAHVTAGVSRRLDVNIVEGSIDHWLNANISKEYRSSMVVYFGQAPTSRLLLNYLTQHARVISLSRGRHAVHPWIHGRAYSGVCAAFLENLTGRLAQGTTAEQNQVLSLTAAIKHTVEAQPSEVMWSGTIFRHLLSIEHKRTNILIGNSLPIRDMDLYTSHLPATVTVMANRGVNGIDGHIATASGIAASDADAATILVCGDLTALHDIAALDLANTSGLKIIVIDNRGGGVFDQLPFAEDSKTFRRLFTAQQSVPLLAIAAAYGIDAYGVEAPSELNLRDRLIRSGSCLCVIDVCAQNARLARTELSNNIRNALETKP
jgi:2-succinyl-5-enolpyruvyl-6-hydroxy-3-cyclohexene-1-carboxylate synthase